MTTRFTRNLRDPRTGKISGREIWYRIRGVFAVLLSVAVIGVGATFVYNFAQAKWTEFKTAEDYEGAGGEEVEVTIPEQANLSKMGDILYEAGVIKTTKAWDREVASNEEEAMKIQPGRYKLRKELPAREALAMLMDRTNQIHNRMTLTEGKWLTEYAKTMAKATGLSEKKFMAAFKDTKAIGLPSYAVSAKNVIYKAEGFVFPDTYELPEKPTAKAVVKLAVTQFKKVAKELDLEAKAEEMNLTPLQVVTVASIIEAEVNRDEDRAKVARVIYNRLKPSWRSPLGFDTTTVYSLQKRGQTELTDAELYSNDSPYNTRNKNSRGLPPGPIDSPGKASLEAALNPADGDWLYFLAVAPGSGETKFFETDAEFQTGKAEYKAWCQASDANYKVCYGKER